MAGFQESCPQVGCIPDPDTCPVTCPIIIKQLNSAVRMQMLSLEQHDGVQESYGLTTTQRLQMGMPQTV